MNENIEINQTKDKELSLEELIVLETIKTLNDPYKLLTVNDVAKDLKVGINTAYEIFKSDSFPSSKFGKNKTVTLLEYTLWKIMKR